jgi:hypothetical protein
VEQRSGGVEQSKLSITIDLELDHGSTISMTRTKSPSPPPTRMFQDLNVDLTCNTKKGIE